MTTVTLQNPIADFAATVDDVVAGVELLTIHFGEGHRRMQTYTPGSGPYYDTVASDIRSYQVGFVDCMPNQNGYGGRRDLAHCGIVPYIHPSLGTNWKYGALTIVNTATNRKKLVHFLLNYGLVNATNLAADIVQKYLSDFVVISIVRKDFEPPTLIATVR